MPRANRHFLPNHVWHLTHRYHEKAFLLKFARDRRRYREVAEMGGTHTLREPKGAYALDSRRESETLTLDNTVLWQKNAEAIET